ncbi:PREDICTED: LSM12 homolog [Prunus dulcis]|uniref:PREDICTED: LSM12 homolog n=1 Tax=Prunus dulcis TaxID=3755 RepID=A0A5E4EV59_PRUDU|nr:hypothetical protein L3X38_016292 [Prunus dulcis]VVA18679.1 PREDICTED: LSM12 homolog [Prunus dulcis]
MAMDDSNAELAIGCFVSIKTTLSDEFQGQVITFIYIKTTSLVICRHMVEVRLEFPVCQFECPPIGLSPCKCPKFSSFLRVNEGWRRWWRDWPAKVAGRRQLEALADDVNVGSGRTVAMMVGHRWISGYVA